MPPYDFSEAYVDESDEAYYAKLIEDLENSAVISTPITETEANALKASILEKNPGFTFDDGVFWEATFTVGFNLTSPSGETYRVFVNKVSGTISDPVPADS